VQNVNKFFNFYYCLYEIRKEKKIKKLEKTKIIFGSISATFGGNPVLVKFHYRIYQDAKL